MRNSSSIILKFVFVCVAFSGMVVGQDSKTKSVLNQSRMPTLFIIGDSTVNNSEEGMKGWGNVIGDYFDRSKINIVNRARGGRSSRTFYTEGLWGQVAAEIKPGDFVLMQFGHNDGGPIDKEKFRGSLKGVGEETQEITVEATGKKETVHTYGWYMKKFISDAKTKGATAIVLSPVPRNIWKDGRVVRAGDDYGKWAAESAKTGEALFVDLNEIVARRYERDGEDKVGPQYFTTKDHTHTSPAGARVNAESVIKGLRSLKKDPLKKYLIKEKS
jgi:rhamnogalacturonan acetylesterase